MSAFTFRSSQPDRWSSPRPTADPAQRRYHYGAIRPMEERPSWFKLRAD